MFFLKPSINYCLNLHSQTCKIWRLGHGISMENAGRAKVKLGKNKTAFTVGLVGLFVLLVNLYVPLAVHWRVCSYISVSEMNLNAQWIFHQSFIYAKSHFFSFPGYETLKSLLNIWDKSIQVKKVLEYISFIEQQISTNPYSVTGTEVEKQLLSEAKKRRLNVWPDCCHLQYTSKNI